MDGNEGEDGTHRLRSTRLTKTLTNDNDNAPSLPPIIQEKATQTQPPLPSPRARRRVRRSLRAALHDAAHELAEPALEARLVEHTRGVEEGVVPARSVRTALGEQRLAGARGAEVGDGEGVVRRLFRRGGERARGESYPLCDDLWGVRSAGV